MITTLLENFFRSFREASQLTEIFVWLILTVFLMGLLLLVLRRGPRFVNRAPSLLTTLGIVGTFTGIFIGLLGFKTTDVDGSIATLLAGMKIAFLTSVLGLSSALLFKFIETLWPDRVRDELEEDVGPQHIYRALTAQNENLQVLIRAIGGQQEDSLVGQSKLLRQEVSDFRIKTTEAINRHNEDFKVLLQAIGGQQEDSLVGQIKLLRTGLSDFEKRYSDQQKAFAEALWRQLSEFAEMMSKSATEQVMEALKQVIADFNKNLTEQFGDNFKKLDESVGRLVTWQENYRTQLEDMREKYALGVSAIDSTKGAVSEIESKAQEIPKSMEALKAVMEVNQHQITELERHLDAFAQIRDQAKNAMPEIKQHLDEVSVQMKEGADSMKKSLVEGAHTFTEATKKSNEDLLEAAATFERTVSGIKESTGAAQESITESTKLAIDSLRESGQRIIESNARVNSETLKAIQLSSDKMLSGVEGHVKEAVGRTNEAVGKQLHALDNAVTTLLNNTFTSMGNAMGKVVDHIRQEFFQAGR